MNIDSFDAVRFLAWFESIIDFIRNLLKNIGSGSKTTVATTVATTTAVADEPVVE